MFLSSPCKGFITLFGDLWRRGFAEGKNPSWVIPGFISSPHFLALPAFIIRAPKRQPVGFLGAHALGSDVSLATPRGWSQTHLFSCKVGMMVV